MRRSALIATVSIVSILALSACGGGNDSPTSADAVEAESETPQQPESDPGEPEILVPISDPGVPAVEAPVVTEAIIPAEQVAEVVGVSLVEWAVESPIELIPGVITFNVTNDGDFGHHFAIARGESYETLPQLADGSIDEATLGTDFLGRTSNMQGGGAETIKFDLEPGNYVFFCNIATAVSHAAQGQVLSVTVADVAL
ncbi:hypothetical protein [Ilumatobacter sp.]|jgi:hypothetical protein|uniref:hypothetical protein n=1 Tax=Ilumatobacter sp. TaxID=1967498 RepID=UPI0030AB846F